MATIAAPPETKTTLDVLRDARALYSENPSHAAKDEIPAKGTFCAVTALSTAAEQHSGFDGAYGALLRATGAEDGQLYAWNAEHTTEEVLAAFDRAIEAA